MANQYLDPTDPVISMLSNEMESKNVPPQQAENYLASQGRQVPGQLAFLMLMNQRLKAAQPQPMPQSTVAQDLQMAMQGQGQVQQPQGPIQPNPAQQQLQRQTMPQQNPMQQGIGQLPQQAVGQPAAYKGGGIVAFNEGGYTVTREEALRELLLEQQNNAPGVDFNQYSPLPDEAAIQRKMREISAKKDPRYVSPVEAAYRARPVRPPPTMGQPFSYPTVQAPNITDAAAANQQADEKPNKNNAYVDFTDSLNALTANKNAGKDAAPEIGAFAKLAGPQPDKTKFTAERAEERKLAGQDELDEAKRKELERITASLPEDRRREMWNNIAAAAFGAVGTPTRKRGLAGALPAIGAAGADYVKRSVQSEKDFKQREELVKKAELELKQAQVAAKMGDFEAFNRHNESYKATLRNLQIEDVKEGNVDRRHRETLQAQKDRSDVRDLDQRIADVTYELANTDDPEQIQRLSKVLSTLNTQYGRMENLKQDPLFIRTMLQGFNTAKQKLIDAKPKLILPPEDRKKAEAAIDAEIAQIDAQIAALGGGGSSSGWSLVGTRAAQ